MTLPTGADIAPIGQGAPVLAIDVGGTTIKAGLIDEAGVVRAFLRRETPVSPDGTADAALSAITETARRLRDMAPRLAPRATGVAIPGIVDDAGRGIHSENLGWRDAEFAGPLAHALGMPTAVTQDVRAAGMAESRLGAAAGAASALVVPIGTGVAAAIIIGGRPYSGGGYAGELGHVTVEADGEPCACGSRGCLETIASARAIARTYSRRTGIAVTGAVDVLTRAERGEPEAIDVWGHATQVLGLSLAHAATLLAPEVIVLAGGLAEAGDRLLDPVRRSLTAALTFQRIPALVTARFAGNAGMIGAALLARDLG